MIPQKLLLDKGGTFRKYKKNQSIFFEGNMPGFYYQIVNGSIKMVSVNESGKEFIQGIFDSGQSFGVPALLVEKPYPASAVANEDTLLIKISKDYPKINFQFTKILAKIIYNYSLIAKAISANKTEGKVLTILKIHKENCGDQGIKNFKIELSRQQIADMTGLRVETVIRTIKKLENKNELKIEKGKIYM